jgi:hypothetical protein
MTNKELISKMLAFIETQDGSHDTEWYASPRDFAATILDDFAQHLGLEMVIPDYVPQLKNAEIDRQAMFNSIMPEVLKLFNMAHVKYLKEQDVQK